nr:MAG TPA: hypothetical protein [Bacteriophage sp.]
MLSNNQYRYALNLRYITNKGENSGELHPVEKLLKLDEFGDKIIASTNIRNTVVVLFTKTYYES